MVKRYRLFGTTADVGVKSWGRDIKEAFENQAAGMFAVMADLRGVRPAVSFGVSASGDDKESLLVAFLNELLFLFDARHVFLREFRITEMGASSLKALALGEEIDPARHVVKTPIKAVTYHMLKVKVSGGSVSTTVVYDI